MARCIGCDNVETFHEVNLSDRECSDALSNGSVHVGARGGDGACGAKCLNGRPGLSRQTSLDEEDCRERVSNRRVSSLVDDLLLEIYGRWNSSRRFSHSLDSDNATEWSTASDTIHKAHRQGRQSLFTESLHRSRLITKDVTELSIMVATLETHVHFAGSLLVRQLKRRDGLVSKRDKQYDVITAFLQALSEKRTQDTRMRFSVVPFPGDSGFTQWHDAMKMVARLPGGIPAEFRRRLWLTLAEKHLQARGVDWSQVERFCFNEWSNPDDDELGVQIVKDLHRTGCSLFCGEDAEENQALLKRVLLGYARWNKNVGYCQGFNMLAALILQVMDRSETDSVKVMIYLIEGVLPESYFANNLRGLSVDMAVFRDLLRLRLPALSRHLEQLQHEAGDSVTGTSYEPPLTNVFTMQWFLTLFSNCLPQSTVLRVWDLIFLEGNEVLLRTALAIWDNIADRIMTVDSADEFYSIMGVLTREMLEFGLMDANNLVKTIVTIAPFPFPELPELRDKYMYNITPWTQTVSTAARRGLRLFYSDDDDDEQDDDEKIAVATAYGISAVFRSPRRRDSKSGPSPSTSLSAINITGALAPDRDRINLDISALKKQYAKLRERQRQAHIILTAACARQPGPPRSAPVAMNHLLIGKNALLNRGRRGPPQGTVPPLRAAPPIAKNRAIKQTPTSLKVVTQVHPVNLPADSGETLHWKDAKKLRRGSQDSVSGRSTQPTLVEVEEEVGDKNGAMDGKLEAKTSSSSDDDSSSSTSTELCDEPDRLSDFDSEEPSVSDTSSSYRRESPQQLTVVKIASSKDEKTGRRARSLSPQPFEESSLISVVEEKEEIDEPPSGVKKESAPHPDTLGLDKVSTLRSPSPTFDRFTPSDDAGEDTFGSLSPSIQDEGQEVPQLKEPLEEEPKLQIDSEVNVKSMLLSPKGLDDNGPSRVTFAPLPVKEPSIEADTGDFISRRPSPTLLDNDRRAIFKTDNEDIIGRIKSPIILDNERDTTYQTATEDNILNVTSPTLLDNDQRAISQTDNQDILLTHPSPTLSEGCQEISFSALCIDPQLADANVNEIFSERKEVALSSTASTPSRSFSPTQSFVKSEITKTSPVADEDSPVFSLSKFDLKATFLNVSPVLSPVNGKDNNTEEYLPSLSSSYEITSFVSGKREENVSAEPLKSPITKTASPVGPRDIPISIELDKPPDGLDAVESSSEASKETHKSTSKVDRLNVANEEPVKHTSHAHTRDWKRWTIAEPPTWSFNNMFCDILSGTNDSKDAAKSEDDEAEETKETDKSGVPNAKSTNRKLVFSHVTFPESPSSEDVDLNSSAAKIFEESSKEFVGSSKIQYSLSVPSKLKEIKVNGYIPGSGDNKQYSSVIGAGSTCESSSASAGKLNLLGPPNRRDFYREHGRRNSERALQIIQENSEILQRILKQNRTKVAEQREPSSSSASSAESQSPDKRTDKKCDISKRLSFLNVSDDDGETSRADRDGQRGFVAEPFSPSSAREFSKSIDVPKGSFAAPPTPSPQGSISPISRRITERSYEDFLHGDLDSMREMQSFANTTPSSVCSPLSSPITSVKYTFPTVDVPVTSPLRSLDETKHSLDDPFLVSSRMSPISPIKVSPISCTITRPSFIPLKGTVQDSDFTWRQESTSATEEDTPQGEKDSSEEKKETIFTSSALSSSPPWRPTPWRTSSVNLDLESPLVWKASSPSPTSLNQTWPQKKCSPASPIRTSRIVPSSSSATKDVSPSSKKDTSPSFSSYSFLDRRAIRRTSREKISPPGTSRDFSVTLGSPTRPITFNPFPSRPSNRQPKEIGLKLGLYSTKEKSKERFSLSPQSTK